jgi:hypothetical protein
MQMTSQVDQPAVIMADDDDMSNYHDMSVTVRRRFASMQQPPLSSSNIVNYLRHRRDDNDNKVATEKHTLTNGWWGTASRTTSITCTATGVGLRQHLAPWVKRN